MKDTTSGTLRQLAGVAIALLVVASSAGAQRRAASGGKEAGQGLMLGVHLLAAPGISIQGEDVNVRTKFGSGGGFMVGYGFNRTWSGYISLDVAKQPSGLDDVEGDFGLGHLEIGARANLPMGNALMRPYLTASVGRRALGAKVTDLGDDEPYDVGIWGSMFALGGGVERALSPTTSLDAGLEFSFGSFGSFEVDGDRYTQPVNRSSTVRLRFGVVWRP